MFSQPNIKKLLSQYVLVKLYTDRVPPKYAGGTTAEENHRLAEKFDVYARPTYLIVEPLANDEPRVLDRTAGKLNVDAFSAFLEKNQLQGFASR